MEATRKLIGLSKVSARATPEENLERRAQIERSLRLRVHACLAHSGWRLTEKGRAYLASVIT